jgi:predicted DNA-binding ribbon-helix-helix protein
LISRNVVINGRRTSFRLEPEMWSAIEEICTKEKVDIHTLCSWIIAYKPRSNRTSAIRAFIVSYLRALVDKAQFQAGHDDDCFCGQDDMSQRLCHVLKAA